MMSSMTCSSALGTTQSTQQTVPLQHLTASPLTLAVLHDGTPLLQPLITAGVSPNGVQDIVNNAAFRACLLWLTADTELEGWLLECCCTPQTLHLQSTPAICTCFSYISRTYDMLLPHCANRYRKWQDARTVSVIFSSVNVDPP